MPPRHVYVHVPFCARRCSYCDFSIAVRRETPVADYIDAIGRELSIRFGGDPATEVDTLYLGGGTPSRLGGDGVARLVDVVARRFVPASGAELTLEANPEDVSAAAAAAWAAAGINRVSLGVQSFHTAALDWMHRGHDAAGVARAVATLQDAGLANWSLDLIFNLPAGLGRDWRADLDGALALAPAHVSLYGLTIESHTPLARWRDRGEPVEGDEDSYAEEFLLAHERLVAGGYEHYEVSNFARPGFRSRHNASYWAGVPYVGLGPSAHGFDGAERRWNEGAWARWAERVSAAEDPLDGREVLTAENRAAENVYLGLRTDLGLALEPADGAAVAPWVEAGWAERSGERLRLTAAGWLRLDALAASLTVARSR